MSHRPGIVCSAPRRAGIIGNPSDMYGGAVISFSDGMRAYPRVELASDLVLHTSGQDYRISDRGDLRRHGGLFDVARLVLDYLDPPHLACSPQHAGGSPTHRGLVGAQWRWL